MIVDIGVRDFKKVMKALEKENILIESEDRGKGFKLKLKEE